MQDNKPDNVNHAALDWESSRTDLIARSERRAWFIAKFCVLISALAIIAMFFMLPLKEAVPFVVRVDNTTGVPDIVTAMRDVEITQEDALNKYWLATYIRARESYNWFTLQKDYNTVGLLSAKAVGADYASLFEGDDALDQRYGKKVDASIKIISIIPTTPTTATIRFIKTIKRNGDKGPGTSTKWLASISFTYHTKLAMKDSERLVNPFGFKVLSYRVDPEMVGG